MYGMKGENPELPSCGDKLADIILARKLYAYGEQNDYFDEKNCIDFVRKGTWDKKIGLACVISDSAPGQLKIVRRKR